LAFRVDPDWHVFVYPAAITLLTTALSGIAPASQALKLQLSQSLKHQAMPTIWRAGKVQTQVDPSDECLIVLGSVLALEATPSSMSTFCAMPNHGRRR
jgi:hypothetical protein